MSEWKAKLGPLGGVSIIRPKQVQREVHIVPAEDGYKMAAAKDLYAALEKAVQYIPTQRIACNGLKCREPHCESCSPEEDVQDALDKAQVELRECLSALSKARGEARETTLTLLEDANMDVWWECSACGGWSEPSDEIEEDRRCRKCGAVADRLIDEINEEDQ